MQRDLTLNIFQIKKQSMSDKKGIIVKSKLQQQQQQQPNYLYSIFLL